MVNCAELRGKSAVPKGGQVEASTYSRGHSLLPPHAPRKDMWKLQDHVPLMPLRLSANQPTVTLQSLSLLVNQDTALLICIMR